MEDEDEELDSMLAENFFQEELVMDFDDVFSIVPGKTSLVEMTIDVAVLDRHHTTYLSQ